MLLDEPVALGAKSPLSLSSQAPTCNLYFSPMARVLNELKAAGKVTGPLSVEDCLPFDQMHYLGTDAMDEAAEVLEVRRGSKILDVGCGFGGPARYMAHKFDCEVVGMDVQQSLIDGCSQLTNRMIDVKDKIKWIRGSATDPEAYRGLEGHFDGLYSMLTILHIPQSDLVWPLAYNSLKLGGKTYHEDFFMKRDFTDEEKHLLEKIVGCSLPLPTQEEYIARLEAAGFEEVVFNDSTKVWSDFVQTRYEMYKNNKEHHVAVQGIDIFETMEQFYSAMNTLFQGGNLGGVCISGRKPAH